MTEWIVSNAWWFAPSLAFAGVGMLVGALLWPRRRPNPTKLASLIYDRVPDADPIEVSNAIKRQIGQSRHRS